MMWLKIMLIFCAALLIAMAVAVMLHTARIEGTKREGERSEKRHKTNDFARK